VRLGSQPFVVLGVLAPKGESGDGRDQDDFVLLPYTSAEKRIRGGGTTWLDDILCSAVSPEAVSRAATQISELMRQRHRLQDGAELDFNIRHPEDAIRAQLDASETFSLLLISVACVALLVGGIGIMNVMLAAVLERTNEIGVRLAVGAKTWAVQAQFLMEAIVLSLLGGVLGLFVSEIGAALIGDMLGWPLSIPPQAVLAATAFSTGIGVIFGWYPAWKASRMTPIEALRRE
jgi:putative ABC transport system permease protein